MKITIGLDDLDVVVPNEMSEIYRLFQKKVYKYLKIYEATEIVTNGHLGAVLQDFQGFKSSGVGYSLMPPNPDPYLIGTLEHIIIYVNPTMFWTDNRIIVKGSDIRVRREKILKMKGKKEFEDFLEEIIIEPKLGNMLF
jgi:hypothetical protein